MAGEQRVGLWIAGAESHDPRRERDDVVDPWTGQVAATVERARPADVEAAVSAAQAFFTEHRHQPGHVRAGWLRAAADAVEGHAARLADIMVATIGKPRRAACVEVTRAAQVLRLSAEEIARLGGETIPLDGVRGGEGRWSLTVRQPYGVAALVTPFNAPVNLLAQKLGPALAVGNATVVKPSPAGAVVTDELVRLLSTCLPAGSVNVLHGGAEQVLDLVARADTRLVSCTGGIAAGRSILTASGIKPVLLELGSNSPNLVLDDADPVSAGAQIARAAYEASGQQCISAQRVLVADAVFDTFAAAFREAAAALVVGDPRDDATDIGPVVHARAADRIGAMIDDALEHGGELLLDGREQAADNPRLLGPTVVAHLPADARLRCEEVFGPVAVLVRVKDLDEAIAVANSTGGLLQASCFTNRLDDALRAARELDAGSVWINEASRFRLDVTPFGGTGVSGVGREGIRYAMEAMSQVKHVGIRPAA